MISLIFVACLLAGSALGHPMINHLRYRQSYIPFNAQPYAVYPCESEADPNGVWLQVQNEKQYVYLAECQQYNGRNLCVAQPNRNIIYLESQPIMYIQPTNNCQRQRCERTCIRSICFSYYEIEQPARPAETTTTTTPAPAPAPITSTTQHPVYAPVQQPPFVQYPPQTLTPFVINVTQTQSINGHTHIPQHLQHPQPIPPRDHLPVPTITEKPAVVSTTQAISTEAPMKRTTITPPTPIDNPSTINPKSKKCISEHGCVSAPQQPIYYQSSGSSSAASAASAGGSSASASAAAGSASASASASSSSQYVMQPGVGHQQYQQYKSRPCNGQSQSTHGSNPCHVHHKGTTSVNNGGLVTEGNQGSYYTEENQSPCKTSQC